MSLLIEQRSPWRFLFSCGRNWRNRQQLTESEAESPQEGDKKDVKTPALRAFGRDLTELAKKDELDPVLGRVRVAIGRKTGLSQSDMRARYVLPL
jgi:ATP-dependent Clp protease ATP-binding subunit ClpA